MDQMPLKSGFRGWSPWILVWDAGWPVGSSNSKVYCLYSSAKCLYLQTETPCFFTRNVECILNNSSKWLFFSASVDLKGFQTSTFIFIISTSPSSSSSSTPLSTSHLSSKFLNIIFNLQTKNGSQNNKLPATQKTCSVASQRCER